MNATLIKAVSPIVRTGGQVIGGVGNWSTQIQGVATNYLEIRDWPLASGDFFTDKDMISESKSCRAGANSCRTAFSR